MLSSVLYAHTVIVVALPGIRARSFYVGAYKGFKLVRTRGANRTHSKLLHTWDRSRPR